MLVESTEFWDNAWKDSMQNAVTVAENRPVLFEYCQHSRKRGIA